nr:hypothetical protein [Tanacetum cinerariifolium]
MPDRRLLELEDQINFLLKGSRPTHRSSTHIPHAYADAVHSNLYAQSQNEPPKLNPFTFRERTGPSPQPQALGTTFEARVRGYMATYSKRMERLKNDIFKQREEINDRMTKMFGLLKELMTTRGEEERSDQADETLDNTVKPTGTETRILVKEVKRNNETKNKPIEKAEKEEVVEVLNSRPIEYYLKHRINEKLIEGLVDNNRGPVYEAILEKMITKKEDIRGNFEIPCSIRGLKHVNALVDQGSNVNTMPYFTHMKLTDEMPAETDIIFSLASHSYIYLLGIAKDILVEVAEHVYPVDFVFLDIKENEKRTFIIETPFLTTTKVIIKFDKGTITLRFGKSKISFHRIPNPPERGWDKWDREQEHMGRSGKVVGTVPVWWGCTGRVYGRGGFLAGMFVKGYCLARTMLADSKLPTMFWTEAVRIAYYVLNRVSVTSPHNKIPYALLTRNIPFVSHFKPFGCHLTILNTSGHLGTQDADSDSDCDEQVIIVPSYPSHNIQATQPIDTPSDKVDDSPFPSADEIFQKELARLKGEEQQGTSYADSPALGIANNAKDLQTPASANPVPTGCIPVPI